MIRMKIAFVLRMINDFSGEWIKDKGFAFYNGSRRILPVEKEDGLYVFLEPQEISTRIFIDSVNYHPCSVVINKKDLDPEEPVVEVRLYEKAGMRFSSGIGLLTGKVLDDLQYPDCNNWCVYYSDVLCDAETGQR